MIKYEINLNVFNQALNGLKELWTSKYAVFAFQKEHDPCDMQVPTNVAYELKYICRDSRDNVYSSIFLDENYRVIGPDDQEIGIFILIETGLATENKNQDILFPEIATSDGTVASLVDFRI